MRWTGYNGNYDGAGDPEALFQWGCGRSLTIVSVCGKGVSGRRGSDINVSFAV